MNSKMMQTTAETLTLNPNIQQQIYTIEKEAPVQFISIVHNWVKNLTDKEWFIRLTHKEFWGMPYLYPLAILTYPFWALRARSFMFFTAANPGIETGGMTGESKVLINKLIPPQYRPKNTLLSIGETLETWQLCLKNADLSYPVIVKPVVGARGLMVEKSA